MRTEAIIDPPREPSSLPPEGAQFALGSLASKAAETEGRGEARFCVSAAAVARRCCPSGPCCESRTRHK